MGGDGAKREALNIGVASFFIAKRAAVKLKLYWKKHKIQKEIDDRLEAERILAE